MCYYNVNFDPSFEYLGFMFAAEVDEAKIIDKRHWLLYLTYTAMLLWFR